ncbi:MAG TPA: LptF/LptG family permease [Opitutaceae bacterium]|nr:LptF/LptG family permease [Opitutaceae bacterium]
MTTTLDRYIFRNVLFASLAAVGVCAFVLLVGNVVKDLLKLLASEQIDVETFIRLTAMLLPYVVAFALPLGVLTGILLVLGRLSAQQEITAMRAAGWGLARIARPIFVLAALGTALSLWFNCELSPRARGGMNLIRADAARVNPLSFIVPREFVRTFPGYVIYVAAKDGTSVRDLSVWYLDGQNRVKIHLRSETGTVEFDEENSRLLITPRNGVAEVRNQEDPGDFTKNPYVSVFSEWQRIPLPLEELVGKGTYRRKLSLRTFRELWAELAEARANPGGLPEREQSVRITQIQYTMQKQVSLAFGVLAFALIGVPLGIKMQRKETSANLGLAVVLALGYLFFQMVIDWSQKRPELHPELLVWTPCLVFAGLGLWLFGRVDRR